MRTRTRVSVSYFAEATLFDLSYVCLQAVGPYIEEKEIILILSVFFCVQRSFDSVQRRNTKTDTEKAKRKEQRQSSRCYER